jgi:RNA polymerase sigma-70 factor, ECF subfamily
VFPTEQRQRLIYVSLMLAQLRRNIRERAMLHTEMIHNAPPRNATETRSLPPSFEDDREALQAVADGERRALDLLYRRHALGVFRFVLRIVGNEALAEELVGDVFIAAWKSAHRYEGRAAPLTWLLSIAHNKAVSALRKRREVTGSIDAVTATLTSLDAAPDAMAEHADRGALIQRCLAKLSGDHKTIVDLIYFREFTVGQAAAWLGIPESTVKTRMFYARKKLAQLLERQGVDKAYCN